MALAAQEIQAQETHPEYGRLYHRWQRGIYWLPHDEDELERLDLLHSLLYNDDKLALPLHYSPLVPERGQPARILDLGCGTGFWAMDMADKYTTAEVIGTDLVNCQPAEIPANVIFRPHCNFNDRIWPFGEETFDMIHLGQITATPVEWPVLYNNVFRYLRPRHGHVEQLDFDITPYIEQGHESSCRLLQEWWHRLVQATETGGRPIAYNAQRTRDLLQNAGFVDIEHRRIPVPWHWYRQHNENYQIGGTFQVAMVQGAGLHAYTIAPFCKVFNWTRQDVDAYLRDLRHELNKSRAHVYAHFHIWTARKP